MGKEILVSFPVTVEPSGSDDTAALQAAVNRAAQAPPPPGTPPRLVYVVDDSCCGECGHPVAVFTDLGQAIGWARDNHGTQWSVTALAVNQPDFKPSPAVWANGRDGIFTLG